MSLDITGFFLQESIYDTLEPVKWALYLFTGAYAICLHLYRRSQSTLLTRHG
jgi:hypothetical protein